MLGFFVGCFVSASVCYVVSAMLDKRSDKRDRQIEQLREQLEVVMLTNDILTEEVNAAHKYFDMIRIPREVVAGKSLTIINRVGLVLEDMPVMRGT